MSYILIRRHWRSAFVVYPTIVYPSLINPHHDVVVHPKSDSLLVRPLALTADEMYRVGAIYIRTPPTPPTPPSLLPPTHQTSTCGYTTRPHVWCLKIYERQTPFKWVSIHPLRLFFAPRTLDSKIVDGPMAPPSIARHPLWKGK